MIDVQNTDYIYLPEEKLAWFGEGEWVGEADCYRFIYKGLGCHIRRVVIQESCSETIHMFGGHLCGYVRIPKELLLSDYDDSIDCHGGLTFCQALGDEFWIGFDCAHTGDYAPSMEKLKRDNPSWIDREFPTLKEFEGMALFNTTYRNLDYCIEECKSIVDQILDQAAISDLQRLP